MTDLKATHLDFAHSPDPDLENPDWAEHAHLLIDHLREVARLARDFAAPFGLADWGYVAGLLHDLGKYRQNFQDYLRGKRFDNGIEKSHKWAGAAYCMQHLTDPSAQKMIASVIAAHHGGLYNKRELQGELKAKADAELRDTMRGRVPQDLFNFNQPAQSDLQSIGPVKKSSPIPFTELLTRFLFSALVDADFQDTVGFYRRDDKNTRAGLKKDHKKPKELLELLEQKLTQFSEKPYDSRTQVDQIRADVSEHCKQAATKEPGCFELTVPTGGGKTLASIRFALHHAVKHGMERVIVVLPFTAIIEQTASIYAEIFGTDQVLEHHSAWDAGDEPEDPELKPLWSRNNRRQKLLSENWDAPIIVTTSVQFLESLHAHKPSRCRKLHNIPNSVVIFDEVQTLPAHLLDITLDTLAALVQNFKTSLVLCTATQPALGKRLTVDGRPRPGLENIEPIIPEPDREKMFRALERVEVSWPESEARIELEDLLSQVREHERVLVIFDQRETAFRAAQTLGPEWLHLSAIMLPGHRKQVIEDIKNTLKNTDHPCRVISTQVVEAGVDIDFPVVYRAMAGFEALAQSAGRCNREGKLEGPGRFIIFNGPKEPPKGILKQGKETARALRRQGDSNLNDPELFKKYFAKLYESSDTDSKGLLKDRNKRNWRNISQKYRLIEEGGQIAIVIPWDGLSENHQAAIQRFREGKPEYGDHRYLNQASVNIPERQAAALFGQGAVIPIHPRFPILYLDLETYPDLYDKRLGLNAFDETEFSPESGIL